MPEDGPSGELAFDSAPQGDSPFDLSRRIVIFAAATGDKEAIKDLESRLPSIAELNDSQRTEVRTLITRAKQQIQTASQTPQPEDSPVDPADSPSGAPMPEDSPESIFALDAVPQGTSRFDHCRRVIIFAVNTGDLEAILSLEKAIPNYEDLSMEQRRNISDTIEKARRRIQNSRDAREPRPEDSPAGGDIERPGPPRIRPGATGGPIPEDSPEVLVGFQLSPNQAAKFSPKYLKIRQRYLQKFFWQGMSAEFVEGEGDSTHVKFADQTIYMGFAMLTFAGECRILSDAGLDTTQSERVLAQLLSGFEELDGAAEEKLYGTSQAGFFVKRRSS